MSAIRVLLADDHVLFRRGIAGLLAGQDDSEVIGEAADGREALDMAREQMPDIILMDLAMPLMTGLEATRLIKSEFPYVRIIILTASDTERSLFEAIKAGAQGYLMKNVDPKALYNTLRGAMRGEASLSRLMAAQLMEEYARPVSVQAPVDTLTAREAEVLARVANGSTNKEIAAALAIAENTVKNHLKNVLEKLHLKNRVQAATFALRARLASERR
jgi:DNA-binding NarL/FixJ family response regulator